MGGTRTTPEGRTTVTAAAAAAAEEEEEDAVARDGPEGENGLNDGPAAAAPFPSVLLDIRLPTGKISETRRS